MYNQVKGVCVFAFRMVLNDLQNELSVWSQYEHIVNIHIYIYERRYD